MRGIDHEWHTPGYLSGGKPAAVSPSVPTGKKVLTAPTKFSKHSLMKWLLVALVFAVACRQPPELSAVHFSAERGSVLISAVDSATGDFIGALSGELRSGSLVTFAATSGVSDTLQFLNVPTGAYQVVIRRIGFKIDTIPAVVKPNDAQIIQIRLPARMLPIGEFWDQRPWWKFWRR